MQEADGDRLDAVTPARGDDRLQVVEFERPEHDATTVDTFANLEPVPAGNERRRLPRHEVVHVRPVSAADLEHIAEAMRGDERSTCPAPLGQRVDDDRGAVHQLGDVLQ